MYKLKLNQILSLIIIILGVLGIVFNFYPIYFLKNISQFLNAIKLTSSSLLIVSGLLLFFIESHDIVEEKTRKMFVSFFVFLSFFIIFLISFTDFQILFISFASDKSINYIPTIYFPSMASLFCFFLIAGRGFSFLFDTNRVKLVKLIGYIILLICFCAIISHLFNNHYLYFNFSHKYVGMEFLPFIGFLISSLILLNSKKRKSLFYYYK